MQKQMTIMIIVLTTFISLFCFCCPSPAPPVSVRVALLVDVDAVGTGATARCWRRMTPMMLQLANEAFHVVEEGKPSDDADAFAVSKEERWRHGHGLISL